MGGFGSGRRGGRPRRAFVTELRSVDINPVARLLGREVAEIRIMGQPVRIVRTLSGRRWFECPACRSRRGVLYEADSGVDRWACRVCHDLAYPSQNESRKMKIRGGFGKWKW